MMDAQTQKTRTGTDIKLNVSINAGNVPMADFDFFCDFYTTVDKKQRVSKEDMIQVDENNYLAIINTKDMHSGTIMLDVFAEIPDADMPNGLRHECATIPTNVYINA